MIDFDIEDNFLGNLLLKPKLMERVVISDECLIGTDNKLIFNLIQKQYKEIGTIDMILIAENYKHMFKNNSELSRNIQKMSELMTSTMMINKFDSYQEALFSRYIKNCILTSIQQYQKKQISTDELLSDIHKYENMSIKLNDNRLNGKQIYELISSKKKKINFRFPILSHRADIGEHDLVVVAARTGIGKSGFILNLIEDLSSTYPCVLFNMEMTEDQVYKRLVAIHSGIPMQYHDNPATEHQREKIEEASMQVGDKDIKIINGIQTINSIRRKVVNESKQGHTLFFIDHIGLVKGSRKYNSPYEQLTEITKEIRRISVDYDCTIFIVSQLNRGADGREPKASDLKESGELEQSASKILLLHNNNQEINLSTTKADMTIYIAKSRNGPEGKISFIYDRANQKFEEKRGSNGQN